MSIWLTVVLWSVAALGAAWLLVTLIKSKKPIRGLLGSALQGLCALAAVNVTGIFTCVSLGLNLFSVLTAALLGVPGVIALLLLKVIFPL